MWTANSESRVGETKRGHSNSIINFAPNLRNLFYVHDCYLDICMSILDHKHLFHVKKMIVYINMMKKFLSDSKSEYLRSCWFFRYPLDPW